MPKFSGTFSGAVKVQTMIAVPDRANHQLILAEVPGVQQCSDPKWDRARITYTAVTDLVAGEGTQRGYFANDHADGDRDWGTFEATAVTRGTEVVVEGKWQLTGGTGQLEGVTGSGIFTSRTTALGEVSASWEGAYQLATSKAQAG